MSEMGEKSVEFPDPPKAIEQERDRNQNAEINPTVQFGLSPKRDPFGRRKIFENLLTGMVKSQVLRIWCELVGIVVILFLSANFYYMAHAMRIVEENKQITVLQDNLEKIEDVNKYTGIYTTVINRTEHLTVEQRFGQRKNRLEQECRAKKLVGSGKRIRHCFTRKLNIQCGKTLTKMACRLRRFLKAFC